MLEELIGAIARGVLGAIAVAIGLELGLRFAGLATVIRYIPDVAMGHRLAPNQQLRRWNKRLFVNHYSMRNGDIPPARPWNMLRILMLGDSVANGGLAIAQHHTIAALLEQQLAEGQAAWPTGQRNPAQVLNASASAWGPRNELGYVQTFGTFDAQIIVLLLNTDDLFAGPPSATSVYAAANDREPSQWWKWWAIAQLFKRNRPIVSAPIAESNCVAMNLEAIRSIHQIAHRHHAQFIVAMTPLRREIVHSEQRHYEYEAKRELHHFLMQSGIPYLDCKPAFRQAISMMKIYHDSIHLTVQGNRLVASLLAQLIRQQNLQQLR
ncbi:GDSL-type esterase/lipase family protein [Leptolyngbya sp. AN02str]|uniref:GDSL-type esterase/lipase family protein n=1 Tax=Leptolyngbya sp. AN02str TaxID=3423363 RepID=UPI003D31CCCD